jgi:lactoylglutathione lyase
MAEIEKALGWVIAYVDDPAAAAALYERTFGLRKDFVVPDEYAQMDTGPTKLGFATYALARGNFEGGVHPAASEGPPPNVEIALVAEDVDAAYRIAVDAGCEALAAPADKPQGQRVGYVRDPSGCWSSSPRRCRPGCGPLALLQLIGSDRFLISDRDCQVALAISGTMVR